MNFHHCFNTNILNFYLPFIFYSSEKLNDMRIQSEACGDYDVAEQSLFKIQRIRERAETGLKKSLVDKHSREDIQIDD